MDAKEERGFEVGDPDINTIIDLEFVTLEIIQRAKEPVDESKDEDEDEKDRCPFDMQCLFHDMNEYTI